MSRAQVERARWIDPIEEFVVAHGREVHRWAILCTYGVSMAALSRHVVPALSKRGRAFRTVLLADAAELEVALRHWTSELPGALNVHGVRARPGIFHPKLAFLRAGRHCRVCFGSANLTEGGLGNNLELWTHSDDDTVVSGCADFLSKLSESRAARIDDAAKRSIRRALAGVPVREVPEVWSSLDETFASRLQRERQGRIEATVVSPLYTGLSGLKKARKLLPSKTITFYTSEGVRLAGDAVKVYDSSADKSSIADDGDEGELRGRELHAKAYAFHNSGGASIWIGSANLTPTALGRTPGRGGNVELLVRSRLPVDEWTAMQKDLDLWFKPSAGTLVPEERRENRPAPLSNLLGCELALGREGPELRIQSIQATGRVVLADRAKKNRVVVSLRRGRGQVSGTHLERLGLSQAALEVAGAFHLFELVGRAAIALVVNVPHVPECEAGLAGTVALDMLLQDLRGRVLFRPVDEHGAEEHGDEATDDDHKDSDSDLAIDAALDEVHHQGLLDQLAVRAVLMKRLITARITVGQRDAFVAEARRELERSVPVHLRDLVQEFFDS